MEEGPKSTDFWLLEIKVLRKQSLSSHSKHISSTKLIAKQPIILILYIAIFKVLLNLMYFCHINTEVPYLVLQRAAYISLTRWSYLSLILFINFTCIHILYFYLCLHLPNIHTVIHIMHTHSWELISYNKLYIRNTIIPIQNYILFFQNHFILKLIIFSRGWKLRKSHKTLSLKWLLVGKT